MALVATTAQAQATTEYAYDAQGQLISVSSANETVSYTYDAAGNRIQVRAGARASPYFGSSAASGGWTDQVVNPRLLADVNGDGRDDIIGFGGNYVFVALGQANGAFAYPVTATTSMTLAFGWTSNTVFPRMAADVNGDGKADIVGFANDGIYVGLGQADGTFATASKAANGFGYNGGWTSQDTLPRFMADMNRDGHADLIAIASDYVWVALAQSSGGFGVETAASTQFTSSQGWTSQNLTPRTVADVNGDRYPDLVGFASDGVYVALGQANGTFATAFKAIAGFGQATGGWTDFNTYPRYVRDVTGDGLADIVGFGSNYVYVSAGQPNGTFAMWQAYTTKFVSGMGWGAQATQPRLVGDVDGDGKPDLLGIAPDGVYLERVPSVAVLRATNSTKSATTNIFPMAAAQAPTAEQPSMTLPTTSDLYTGPVSDQPIPGLANSLSGTVPPPLFESPR